MNLARLRLLPFVLLFLPLDFVAACVFLSAELFGSFIRLLPVRGSRILPADTSSVTIQILNWDGMHLLKESLPRVLEAASGHQVVVVDNGSRDGSIEFLQAHFPEVRIVALDRNYGFAVGNNRGFEHVRTDIVVLLNNDMLVERDFLKPLLEPFAASEVFAVTSQIFFPDTSRRREETGNTRMRYERGMVYMWHEEIPEELERLEVIAVAWAGGGSCAIDRRRLAELGGFDELYDPFYVEDADLSYQAWKRGWKSLLVPASHVIHKHRGTSRPRFGDDFVNRIVRRNHYLFVWKNLTDLGMFLGHLLQLPRIHGSGIEREGFAFEFWAFSHALWRLPQAVLRRLANLRECRVGDRDILKHTS